MPVSHIGLTVSDLNRSCTFFLAALQPLGYRFIGQQGTQIGLGINDADFFICQETAGIPAGAAHIAFTAPSQQVVKDFYSKALSAGAKPHGEPSTRDQSSGYYSAAVLDIDGNSVEVVHRPLQRSSSSAAPSAVGSRAGTVVPATPSVLRIEGPRSQRVMDWNRSVVSSTRMPATSAGGSSYSQSPSATRSLVPSNRYSPPLPRAVTRSQTAPVTRRGSYDEHMERERDHQNSKRLVGTLLGAAAGAAVAYAMTRAEDQDEDARRPHGIRRSNTHGHTTSAYAGSYSHSQLSNNGYRTIEASRSYASSATGPRLIEAGTKFLDSAPSAHGSSRVSTIITTYGPKLIEAIPLQSTAKYNPPSHSSSSHSQHSTTSRRLGQDEAVKYALPASSVDSRRASGSEVSTLVPGKGNTYTGSMAGSVLGIHQGDISDAPVTPDDSISQVSSSRSRKTSDSKSSKHKSSSSKYTEHKSHHHSSSTGSRRRSNSDGKRESRHSTQQSSHSRRHSDERESGSRSNKSPSTSKSSVSKMDMPVLPSDSISQVSLPMNRPKSTRSNSYTNSTGTAKHYEHRTSPLKYTVYQEVYPRGMGSSIESRAGGARGYA